MRTVIQPCAAGKKTVSVTDLYNIRLVRPCGDKRTGGAGGALDITHMPEGIHQVSVTSGLLADECLAIIQEFFRKRRQEK